jgi:outer membrane protein assembly factor BamB
VYSLGAKTGEIQWSQSTDDWVYASPAVARQTVYVGSYDGNFYALDAVTGDTKWSFDTEDRIAGSATVVGDLVWFSTMGGTTYALNARNGVVRWQFDDGRYSPVIVDETQLYLTGHTRQYAFRTLSPASPSANAKRASQ